MFIALSREYRGYFSDVLNPIFVNIIPYSCLRHGDARRQISVGSCVYLPRELGDWVTAKLIQRRLISRATALSLFFSG